MNIITNTWRFKRIIIWIYCMKICFYKNQELTCSMGMNLTTPVTTFRHFSSPTSICSKYNDSAFGWSFMLTILPTRKSRRDMSTAGSTGCSAPFAAAALLFFPLFFLSFCFFSFLPADSATVSYKFWLLIYVPLVVLKAMNLTVITKNSN